MDILDARTNRALAFVSALSDGGAAPTADAVDEFYSRGSTVHCNPRPILHPRRRTVLMLGMSLDGVGKKVEAITELGCDASKAIRETHEELWAELSRYPSNRRVPMMLPEGRGKAQGKPGTRRFLNSKAGCCPMP